MMRWAPLQGLTLLYRSKNEGMDIAAHNTTLQWHAANSKRVYKYFIFLNSSIRGPFLPSYVPVGFQWTQASLTQEAKRKLSNIS